MTEQEWLEARDPISMIWHLAEHGCKDDFSLFESEIGNRIRSEVTEPLLISVLNGPTEQASYRCDFDRK